MKIPTAEEFFKKYSDLYCFEEGPSEYLIDRESFKIALLESNKLHVEAALQAAANNVDFDFKKYPSMDTHGVEIDEDSIINAYPENLIQ